MEEAGEASNQPVPDLRGETGAPLGARIAGAVLMVNGVAAFGELFLPGVNDPTSGVLHSPLAIIVDLAVGLALLRGAKKWQNIAVYRVLLGCLLFTGAAVFQEDWFQAGFQVLFSASLLGLLWGKAGRARVGASLAATTLLMVIEGIGLYSLSTGRNPLTRVVLSMKDEIDGSPLAEIRGERATWSLKLPPGRWYLRKSAAAAKDNALVDRWMIDPARDMHVLVIAEPVTEEVKLDADGLMKAVLTNASAAASAFKIVEPPVPLASSVGQARLAHSASTVNGISVETYHAVFLTKDIAFQVFGFGPSDKVALAGDELKGILRSFSQ
jgi:hypothetical protein